MIDTALTTLIASTSGIAPDCITPGTDIVNLGDETLPRLAYTQLPSGRTYTDSGAIGVRTGNYQLDIFATSLTDAKAKAAAMMRPANATAPADRGLDGYRGTVDSTLIQRIWFPNELRHETTPVRDGQNTAIVRVSVDLNVSFRGA